jgi:pimeloyl-ACP methyl ester carboxylesterase
MTTPTAHDLDARSARAAGSSSSAGRRRAGPARRAGRWAAWGLAFVLVLAFVGAAAQALLERRDARAHPPPGDLVDVGGRDLHLHVTGEHGGPTVVMEAGLGAPSTSWAWVQPAVDDVATVVSYDRAGIGWSEPPAADRDPATTVADLRTALQARGLAGPYVLVAHSMGAFVARAFAGAHPDEVAALVLVDPSHEAQYDAYPAEQREQVSGAPRMMRAAAVAARFGIFRIHHPSAFVAEGMPEDARGAYSAWIGTPQSWSVMADEMEAFDAYGRAAADARLPEDLPVRIISADTSDDPEAQWMTDLQLERHAELEQLTADTERTVLPGASHFTVLTDQHYAEQVADLVARTVEQVRSLSESPAAAD